MSWVFLLVLLGFISSSSLYLFYLWWIYCRNAVLFNLLLSVPLKLWNINVETAVALSCPWQSSSFFLHLLSYEFISRTHSFLLTVTVLFIFSLLFWATRPHCPEFCWLAQKSKNKSKMIKAWYKLKARKLHWTKKKKKKSDKKAILEKQTPQNKIYLSKKATEWHYCNFAWQDFSRLNLAVDYFKYRHINKIYITLYIINIFILILYGVY